MIQELSTLNGNLQSRGLIVEGEALQTSSALQSKEVLLALSKIQLGEVLSGKILIENEQVLLKLQNGLKLAAQLPKGVPTNQLLDFLVVGKSRQHLELEAVLGQGVSKNMRQVSEAAIKELGLPENPQMQKIVGEWMDQQLPFVKHQMLQLYQMAKTFHLPSESLTNLVAGQIPLSEKDASLVAQFKEQGSQFMHQVIEEAFEGLEPNKASQLVKALGQQMDSVALKQTLLDTLEPIVRASSHTETNEISDTLEKNMDQLVQMSQQLDDSEVKEPLTTLQEKMTQLAKTNFDKPNQIIQIFEDMMPFLTKGTLKSFAHKFAHEYLTLNSKKLSDDPNKEIVKMEETSKRIQELLKEIEKVSPKEESKTHFQNAEQITQAFEKYNQQGQYYCFPMYINEKQTTGELYFFKPKKNKKGQANQSGMYIVLALNMPSLNQVEVHLIEKNDALQLKIKVAEENIKRQMNYHLEKLKKSMDETMMPIKNIEIGLIDAPAHKQISHKNHDHFNQLDFRI